MSYLYAAPEIMTTAAADLAATAAIVNSASQAAALPTTRIFAAGADEVSAAIAALFSGHAQRF